MGMEMKMEARKEIILRCDAKVALKNGGNRWELQVYIIFPTSTGDDVKEMNLLFSIFILIA